MQRVQRHRSHFSQLHKHNDLGIEHRVHKGGNLDLVSPHFMVGVVLFDDFELLEVTGPLEILGHLPENFATTLIGQSERPVRSTQGIAIVPDCTLLETPPVDLLIVPGGQGTRTLVNDVEFLAWLNTFGHEADLIASICTGSALLGKAGLLEGYRATSNKRAFDWVQSVAPNVAWEPHARWVADRDRWSSSGIAAGLDMTLALVACLIDESTALELANKIEYGWHTEANWDPFSEGGSPDNDGGSRPVITVFRSRLRSDHQDYEPLAQELESLAREQPGFLSFKTFTADDGERCSIVVFSDAKAQHAWKTLPLHAMAQRRAAKEFYTEFSVQVGEILREVRVQENSQEDAEGAR